MKSYLALFMFGSLLFANAGHGQDASLNPFVTRHFLILKSTKNYLEAANFVQDASQRLGMKIDLRNAAPNDKTGLSFTKKECDESEWDFPCYVARGRWDEGAYLSIEYSNAYEDFAKGFFIVVGASGDRSSVSKVAESTRKQFPDAYVKKAKVYMGCMH